MWKEAQKKEVCSGYSQRAYWPLASMLAKEQTDDSYWGVIPKQEQNFPISVPDVPQTEIENKGLLFSLHPRMAKSLY